MLITKKERTGWVERDPDTGLYLRLHPSMLSGVRKAWGPIEDATIYESTRPDLPNEVPVTVRTYYIVNTSGESYVPPV